MDEREKIRMQLTGAVAKLLKYRSFRDALPPLTADGEAPFIVGLLDDKMKTVNAMAARMGDAVHLVVPDAPHGDSVRVRVLRVTRQPDGPEPGELSDDDCPVDENSTLAMLLNLLEVGGEITCHVYDHETMVQFVADGMQPVPA